MVKKVFEVGDSVKSVLVKTHGKDGVVASVDGKKITVQWTRGFPTEETSRRLVHAADYQPRPTKSTKRKAPSPASSSSSSALKRPCAETVSAPESDSESDNSDGSADNSDESDGARGALRDRFTGHMHQDTCGSCGQGGFLYECDWCDCAYHLACTGLPEGEAPPDDYKCYQCSAEEAQEDIDGNTRYHYLSPSLPVCPVTGSL